MNNNENIDAVNIIDVEYSVIEGSGGGGSSKGGNSQRTPREASDTLVSEDYARVVAVISEGEIEGFSIDQNQSIFLNDTPLVNGVGQANFTNYDIDYRLGTPSQTKLKGTTFTSQVFNVGTKIENGTPVNFTITDSTVDSVIITIATPVFQNINTKNGDIDPTSVAFSFYISSGGGPFVLQNIPTGFNGKSSGEFSYDYQIGLTGSAPWTIRVTRDTPNSTRQDLQNDIYLQRYTEVKYNPNTFNNRAVLYACFPAKYFNEIPKITAKMKGIKCPIPHNYNPITRQYTGVFNGTLTSGWTNNPAWILYDILTDTRYGMGLPSTNIDVYSFYSLGQYCDGYISNGLGGYEPRYTFNTYITQRTEAYKLVESIAASCRCKIYLSNGSVVVVPDKPKSPTRSYNRSNVIVSDETPPFRYTSTPLEERYPVVNVTWFDPSNNYKAKTETVSDSVQLAKYGYNSVDVTAFGCTSRGQAIRYARWLIYTSCYSIKSVEFTVDHEGLNVTPGEVISINDYLQNQSRSAGRLVSGTTTNLTLDSAVSLVSGQTYTLYTEDTNGGLLQTSFTSGSTTTTSTLNGLFTLSATPRKNAAWSLVTSTTATQWWITSITENSEEQTYTIRAIQYEPTKYTDVETFSQSNLTFTLFKGYGKALAPNNVQLKEILFEDVNKQKIRTKLSVLWAVPNTAVGVAGYEIGWKRYYDYNWNTARTVFTSYEILDPETLLYNIRIRTLSRGGNHSDYTYYDGYVRGLTVPPSDITGLNINSVPGSNSITLNWDAIQDIDVRVNGYVEVRFNASVTNTDWTNGVRVALLPGNTTQSVLPKQSGTYLVKAIDSSGNYSYNPTYTNTSYIDIRNLNIIDGFDAGLYNFPDFTDRYTVSNEPSDWTKGLVDGFYNPSLATMYEMSRPRINVTRSGSDLTLSTIDLFDDEVDIFNSSEMFNASGSTKVKSIGYYAYPFILWQINGSPITSEFINNMTYQLNYTGSYVNDKFNSDELMDSIDTFDAAKPNVKITPQYKKFTYNSGTLTFSDGGVSWNDLVTGELNGGVFIFRLKFESFDEDVTLQLTDAVITVDVPDREEKGSLITNPTGAMAFVFTNPFVATPNYVGVNIRNANSGDYVNIISVDKSQLVFQVLNSSGTVVSRTVDVLIKGVGRQTN